MDAPVLGFIGLGHMGGPMAGRFIGAGHTVHVYDIAPQALQAQVAVGGQAAVSPRAVADAAQIVFTCLAAPQVVRAVALGDNGLAGGKSIRILVDCSTTSPEFIRALGDDLEHHGVTVLDSPISGGVTRARDGELSIISSGPRDAYEEIRGLLPCLGRPFYLGEKPGMAQMAKLINNLLSNVATAATYEAFVLGAKAGLDPDVLLDVVNASTGVNNCTLHKMPRSVLPRSFNYGSNMEITYKDMSQCMKEAERLGVTMLLGNMARQLWSHGYHHGGAKRDSSSLIQVFEGWAGVEVAGKAARAGKPAG